MLYNKLKALHNITHQEEAVVKYIVDHPGDLLKMNINDLAVLSYSSTSTIVRLCKKLGYKGFSEFKLTYVSEFSLFLEQQEHLMDIPFTPKSSLNDVVSRLPMIYQKAIDQTRTMFDYDVLCRCIKLIQKSKHIGIYGTGLNFDIAKMYQYKFEEVGVAAIAYDSAHWQHLSRLKLHDIPSFAILISLTGSNPIILDIAKRMSSLSIPTLCISGRDNDKLSSLCTESIRIIDIANTLELYNLTSAIAAQYILDIFVAMSVIKNYEEILSITKETTINLKQLIEP
jgi:RpiR family transcriptional regulator, carbohydrate utilization regulator